MPIIPEALEAVGATKYIDIVNSILPMYDPDSDVSIDYTVISAADEKFKEIYDSDEFCRIVADYIKKNKEIFLN